MKEEGINKNKNVKEQPECSPDNGNKENQPLSTEGQIVIEEKQSKPNGEVNIV